MIMKLLSFITLPIVDFVLFVCHFVGIFQIAFAIVIGEAKDNWI